MTELQDETKSGTATISVTPRAARRSTAAWMFVTPGPWMLARFASIEEGLDLSSRPNANLPIVATFHVAPDATVEVAVP